MNFQDTKVWRNTKLPELSLMEGVLLLSIGISDCFHPPWDGQAEVRNGHGAVQVVWSFLLSLSFHLTERELNSQ